MDKPVLVLGATGQQGGSVARALLEDGWRVKALVRDPRGQKARALGAAGVETVAGDLGDVASLRSALEGAYGVFSVQPSSGQPEYGVTDDDELRFGIDVADAARDAGVKHLVYSSVAGAGPDTGVGHFTAKWRIEEHVRSLDIGWTIVRPAAFMEILLLPQFGLAQGELTFFMQPRRAMQFIAVEDIGRIVAKVFVDRSGFRGKVFDIAGDALTGVDLAAGIASSTGRRLGYRRFPDAMLQEVPLLKRLVELVDEGPAAGSANIEALRGLHPALQTFATWLERSGRDRIEPLLPRSTA